MRKDLKDESLQVGKDYWESKDLNPSFPTLAEWRKRWFEMIIKEKEGDRYWREWYILPRDWHYWVVYKWKIKWIWCDSHRSDGKVWFPNWRG